MGNIEGKLSTKEVTGTISTFEFSREASIKKVVSAKANIILGEAEASIDKNLNINGKIDVSNAEGKVQVGEKANLGANSKGKIELGAKLSILKAKVAINMEALANALLGIGEAAATAILPESLYKPISNDEKIK